MGVECQDIYFQNGYPVLYTKEGELDTSLFDVDKRNWKTVYLNGLDNTMGYLYDTGVKLILRETSRMIILYSWELT